MCSVCHELLSEEIPDKKWQKMTISQIREHFKEKERLAGIKECAFCGKPFGDADAEAVVLKDGSKVCRCCVDSIRIVRPVFCTEEYDSSKGEYLFASDDPLKEMTLEDFPAAKEAADAERAARTAKYGEHKAVFSVDDVVRCGDREDSHIIRGRVLLGSLAASDRLSVNRKECPYFFEISEVKPMEYDKDKKVLAEGHGGSLLINGEVSCVYPGDILTVD